MRDPLWWMPLKFKLPLAFILMGAAAFGITGLVTALTAQQLLESQVLREMNHLASAQARTVEAQLELLHRRAEDFSSDGYIRTRTEQLIRPDLTTQQRTESAEALKAHMIRNKLPLVGAFVDSSVLAMDRTSLMTVSHPVEGERIPRSLAHPWSGPLRPADAIRPYPSFMVAVPLWDMTRTRLVGILVLVVRADSWIESISLPAVTIDSDRVRSQLADENGLALPLAGGAAKSAAWQRQAWHADKLLRYDLPLSVGRWKVIVEADRDAVLAPVERLFTPFLLTGGLVLAVATVILIVLVQFVLKPLSLLREAARKIASGQFDIVVDVAPGDEIGDLARAFSSMAQAVQQRSRHLLESADELRRQEAATRQERDRLQAVIRSMDDGMFILDSNGQVTLSNKSAAPLLKSMKSNSPALRLLCRNHAENSQNCQQCLLNWKSPTEPCVIRLNDRIYEVSVTSLIASETNGTERLYVSRDITERVSEAELQAHQERMAVVGKMTAVVAHELNNPLAAIAMFGQMLERELPEESLLREHAGIIRRNTEACARTIRMLLESSAQSPPLIEEFDLHDLLHDTVAFIEPLARKANASVKLRSEAKNSMIFGEERHLRQVFINLIINSIQAMDSNGGSVTIHTRDADDFLLIEVSDTGGGIPPEHVPHIFKPFYSSKPAGVGTGLGLPTSQQIVTAHGGRLELVESRPGRTRFRVTLKRFGKPDPIRFDMTLSPTIPRAIESE